MMRGNWIDRTVSFFAPQAGLRRLRARAAAEIVARHYEAASSGRRTQGWRRGSGDANAMIGPASSRLREAARDLVRNNGHAENALTTICDHVVGWGIVAKPNPSNVRAAEVWRAWAETTDCDADGQNDFYGLQHLALRTVAESGEVLVRRRFRLPGDRLALPFQIQVIDPDYLDTSRIGSIDVTDAQGQRIGTNKIIHGVEYDFLGRRVAYWLFREHPGNVLGLGSAQSYRVPAESVLHIYRKDRPGQVRGASWFAPVLLKFKDFDEYEDATLMKQKIAACLAVITSDVDGSMAPLGTKDTEKEPEWDSLEPGMILNAQPGRTIEVVQPPTVREYSEYSKTSLRTLATGLGVSYEDLTGDYSQVNFSSARMSRLRHWARVEGWRWRMLIPQLCQPVWAWAMEAAAIMGKVSSADVGATWTAPPLPMVDPEKEGQAYKRNVRSGLMSLSEAIRERGYDPETVLRELAADNKLMDELGLMLDSDPRKTSDAGLTQARAGQGQAPADAGPTSTAGDGNGGQDGTTQQE